MMRSSVANAGTELHESWRGGFDSRARESAPGIGVRAHASCRPQGRVVPPISSPRCLLSDGRECRRGVHGADRSPSGDRRSSPAKRWSRIELVAALVGRPGRLLAGALPLAASRVGAAATSPGRPGRVDPPGGEVRQGRTANAGGNYIRIRCHASGEQVRVLPAGLARRWRKGKRVGCCSPNRWSPCAQQKSPPAAPGGGGGRRAARVGTRRHETFPWPAGRRRRRRLSGGIFGGGRANARPPALAGRMPAELQVVGSNPTRSIERPVAQPGRAAVSPSVGRLAFGLDGSGWPRRVCSPVGGRVALATLDPVTPSQGR